MFQVPRHLGYSQRQTPHRFEFRRAREDYPEEITCWGIDWREQMKFYTDRRPHPAYHYWRNVHPCYYCRRREYGSVRILKEAWIVKVERGSPRTMKPISSREA
jgi:hypothetical protein